MNFLKKLFCLHDYELINQFEIKSEFDIVLEAGLLPAPHRSLKRIIVSDYKCSKCNKLKRLKRKTIT